MIFYINLKILNFNLNVFEICKVKICLKYRNFLSFFIIFLKKFYFYINYFSYFFNLYNLLSILFNKSIFYFLKKKKGNNNTLLVLGNKKNIGFLGKIVKESKIFSKRVFFYKSKSLMFKDFFLRILGFKLLKDIDDLTKYVKKRGRLLKKLKKQKNIDPKDKSLFNEICETILLIKKKKKKVKLLGIKCFLLKKKKSLLLKNSNIYINYFIKHIFIYMLFGGIDYYHMVSLFLTESFKFYELTRNNNINILNKNILNLKRKDFYYFKLLFFFKFIKIFLKNNILFLIFRLSKLNINIKFIYYYRIYLFNYFDFNSYRNWFSFLHNLSFRISRWGLSNYDFFYTFSIAEEIKCYIIKDTGYEKLSKAQIAIGKHYGMPLRVKKKRGGGGPKIEGKMVYPRYYHKFFLRSFGNFANGKEEILESLGFFGYLNLNVEERRLLFKMYTWKQLFSFFKVRLNFFFSLDRHLLLGDGKLIRKKIKFFGFYSSFGNYVFLGIHNKDIFSVGFNFFYYNFLNIFYKSFYLFHLKYYKSILYSYSAYYAPIAGFDFDIFSLFNAHYLNYGDGVFCDFGSYSLGSYAVDLVSGKFYGERQELIKNLSRMAKNKKKLSKLEFKDFLQYLDPVKKDIGDNTLELSLDIKGIGGGKLGGRGKYYGETLGIGGHSQKFFFVRILYFFFLQRISINHFSIIEFLNLLFYNILFLKKKPKLDFLFSMKNISLFMKKLSDISNINLFLIYFIFYFFGYDDYKLIFKKYYGLNLNFSYFNISFNNFNVKGNREVIDYCFKNYQKKDIYLYNGYELKYKIFKNYLIKYKYLFFDIDNKLIFNLNILLFFYYKLNFCLKKKRYFVYFFKYNLSNKIIFFYLKITHLSLILFGFGYLFVFSFLLFKSVNFLFFFFNRGSLGINYPILVFSSVGYGAFFRFADFRFFLSLSFFQIHILNFINFYKENFLYIRKYIFNYGIGLNNFMSLVLIKYKNSLLFYGFFFMDSFGYFFFWFYTIFFGHSLINRIKLGVGIFFFKFPKIFFFNFNLLFFQGNILFSLIIRNSFFYRFNFGLFGLSFKYYGDIGYIILWNGVNLPFFYLYEGDSLKKRLSEITFGGTISKSKKGVKEILVGYYSWFIYDWFYGFPQGFWAFDLKYIDTLKDKDSKFILRKIIVIIYKYIINFLKSFFINKINYNMWYWTFLYEGYFYFFFLEFCLFFKLFNFFFLGNFIYKYLYLFDLFFIYKFNKYFFLSSLLDFYFSFLTNGFTRRTIIYDISFYYYYYYFDYSFGKYKYIYSFESKNFIINNFIFGSSFLINFFKFVGNFYLIFSFYIKNSFLDFIPFLNFNIITLCVPFLSFGVDGILYSYIRRYQKGNGGHFPSFFFFKHWVYVGTKFVYKYNLFGKFGIFMDYWEDFELELFLLRVGFINKKLDFNGGLFGYGFYTLPSYGFSFYIRSVLEIYFTKRYYGSYNLSFTGNLFSFGGFFFNKYFDKNLGIYGYIYNSINILDIFGNPVRLKWNYFLKMNFIDNNLFSRAVLHEFDIYSQMEGGSFFIKQKDFLINNFFGFFEKGWYLHYLIFKHKTGINFNNYIFIGSFLRYGNKAFFKKNIDNIKSFDLISGSFNFQNITSDIDIKKLFFKKKYGTFFIGNLDYYGFRLGLYNYTYLDLMFQSLFMIAPFFFVWLDYQIGKFLGFEFNLFYKTSFLRLIKSRILLPRKGKLRVKKVSLGEGKSKAYIEENEKRKFFKNIMKEEFPQLKVFKEKWMDSPNTGKTFLFNSNSQGQNFYFKEGSTSIGFFIIYSVPLFIFGRSLFNLLFFSLEVDFLLVYNILLNICMFDSGVVPLTFQGDGDLRIGEASLFFYSCGFSLGFSLLCLDIFFFKWMFFMKGDFFFTITYYKSNFDYFEKDVFFLKGFDLFLFSCGFFLEYLLFQKIFNFGLFDVYFFNLNLILQNYLVYVAVVKTNLDYMGYYWWSYDGLFISEEENFVKLNYFGGFYKFGKEIIGFLLLFRNFYFIKRRNNLILFYKKFGKEEKKNIGILNQIIRILVRRIKLNGGFYKFGKFFFLFKIFYNLRRRNNLILFYKKFGKEEKKNILIFYQIIKRSKLRLNGGSYMYFKKNIKKYFYWYFYNNFYNSFYFKGGVLYTGGNSLDYFQKDFFLFEIKKNLLKFDQFYNIKKKRIIRKKQKSKSDSVYVGTYSAGGVGGVRFRDLYLKGGKGRMLYIKKKKKEERGLGLSGGKLKN